MIEFIVAVDPRPDTKAKHFVSVAQALGRGLVRPWCHARKRDRFSAHPKPQKFPDRLGLLRHVALPSTHFFPRRALIHWSFLAGQRSKFTRRPIDRSRGRPGKSAARERLRATHPSHGRLGHHPDHQIIITIDCEWIASPGSA